MRKITILLGMTLLATTLVLTGCGGGSDLTEGDRVREFMGDISNASSFAGVGGNIHPDAQQYDQVQAGSYWEATFAFNTEYTLDGLSISGGVGTANLNGGTYSNAPIEFTFKNDPEDSGGLFGGGETDNYKIIRLELDNNLIVQ
jgi:hypothetical protein